ncbi:MAG TPA: GyrI-like domain-containing protein [Planctomycetota bacterium]|jgi:effector-binding domain-containing protein
MRSFFALLLAMSCFALLAAEAAPEIQIKDVKKQTTLVIKKKIKQSEIGAALGQILPKVFAFAGQNKIQPFSAPMTRYTKAGEDEFNIEAGFVVAEGTKGQGEIVVSELPGGKAASTVHKGPYEKLSATYKALKEFIKVKGLKEGGTGWEFYVSDPDNTKPEELKTEVYMQVEEK